MKLQNGRNVCNWKMPQFVVCFNHLRKYFFSLCMEYFISKNVGYWIVKYSSWLFRISQKYMGIWSTGKILSNIDAFLGQFGTTPDLSGEALSTTTLARNLWEWWRFSFSIIPKNCNKLLIYKSMQNSFRNSH